MVMQGERSREENLQRQVVQVQLIAIFAIKCQELLKLLLSTICICTLSNLQRHFLKSNSIRTSQLFANKPHSVHKLKVIWIAFLVKKRTATNFIMNVCLNGIHNVIPRFTPNISHPAADISTDSTIGHVYSNMEIEKQDLRCVSHLSPQFADKLEMVASDAEHRDCNLTDKAKILVNSTQTNRTVPITDSDQDLLYLELMENKYGITNTCTPDSQLRSLILSFLNDDKNDNALQSGLEKTSVDIKNR